MQNRIMKIYYLFLFLVLITFSNANAQITKGNWIVGGSFSYIRINNSSPNNALYKESILNIKPIFGYFLKDKFALGLRSEFNNVTIIDGNRSSNYRLDFGPFLRYYFFPVNKSVNLFSESAYLLSLWKSDASKWGSNNGFLINVGPAVYLNNIVGLEFTLGYSSQFWKNNNGSLNNIRTGIGLQIHLEKAD
jgi:hypothetical protein